MQPKLSQWGTTFFAALGPHVREDTEYCWRDPNQGFKHFSLELSVLQKLLEYAENGDALRTHDDVPQYIRDLIHAKDEADSERRKKKQKPSSMDGVPQMHIHTWSS